MHLRNIGRALRRATAIIATATAAAVLLPTTSAHAYTLLPHFWDNPGALSYCFDGRKLGPHNGAPYRYPLPTEYQPAVETAAQQWSRTPTPVLVMTHATCVADTNVRVHGIRSGPDGSGGAGGCLVYERAYKSYSANECILGSGFLYLNIDIDYTTYPRFFLYTALHELGHVIGLDHTSNKPCYNRCYGPVMSYGSCPREDRCVAAPSTDDINGVNRKYHYTPKPSGGGCRTTEGNTVQRTMQGVFETVEDVDTAVQGVDRYLNQVAENSGVADPVRDTTGQDPLAVFDAANGTAGKVLWTVADAAEQLTPEC